MKNDSQIKRLDEDGESDERDVDLLSSMARLDDARQRAAKTLRKHEALKVRDRTPYGPDSPHSFFVDQARREHDPEARERLNRERAVWDNLVQTRAVGSGTLGAIVPGSSGLPAWTAEAVSEAAHSAAPLAAALVTVPLPPEGLTVPVAKFTAGATGTVQIGESSAPTDSGGTPPAVSFDNEPLATFETFTDYSLQASDRSGGAVDYQLAVDIGAAYGAKLESELFVGPGSGNRIRGLNNATPTTTKTVAAQTLADFMLKSWDAWQTVTTTFGQPPDLLVLHPRRYATLQANDTNEAIADVLPVGDNIVASPGQVTTLGGGAEDWSYLLVRAATPLFTDGPKLEYQTQSSGTTLTTRVLIYGYAAFASAARPESVAAIKGTTAPTF